MYTASNEALPIRMKEYSPMNVPQNDLNEVANRAESIRSAMGRALALVNGDTAGNAQGTLLQITMENLVSLQMKLENIGAHYSPEYAPPETDPLLLQSDDKAVLAPMLLKGNPNAFGATICITSARAGTKSFHIW